MKLAWSKPDTYKSYESWENEYFRIVRRFGTYVMYYVLDEVETTSSDENFDKLVELATYLYENHLVNPHIK